MSTPSRSTLSFFEKINHDMDALKRAVHDPITVKKAIGAVHMERIRARFIVLTLKQGLTLAEQNHLLDKLYRLTGFTVNLAVLDAPLGVFNALSVALPLTRFLFNIGLALQQALFSEDPDKTALALFWQSILDNHVEIVNDGVWAIVNGLSNYAPYFNLSPMTSNVLTGAFLLFDIVWLKHVLTLAEQQYEADKVLAGDDDGALQRLELNITNTRAKLYFCMTAGALLVTGFGLAVIASSPILVPLCLLVSNVGIAMYLTNGKYGTYQEKNLLLRQQSESLSREDSSLDVSDYVSAYMERDAAWTDLVETMLKNTIMPFILISAYTLNVPAAIVLTVAYIASEQGMMSYAADLITPSVEGDPDNGVSGRLSFS